MRFICRDIDQDSNIIQHLFLSRPSVDPLVIEDGIQMDLFFKDYVETQGTFYYYGNDTTKKYLQVKTNRQNRQSLDTFETWSGVTIENNFSTTISAIPFIFNVSKLFQLKTKMWFTIFTDQKIIFALPKRISTSNFISNDKYKVVGTHKHEYSNINLENDNADININIDHTDTIKPWKLDDTIKKMVLDCEKSRNDMIYITSGYKINPMDYVIYNGKPYLAVSQKRDKNQLLYTCIKESDETYTFNGGEIICSDLFVNTNENMVAWNSVEVGEQYTFEIADGSTLFIDDIYKSDIPTGSIIQFAGTNAPAGWAICDGSTLSRTVQASLYSVIGITYGSGDGSTTFNIPDLRGIFVKGAGTTNRVAGVDAAGRYYSSTLGTYSQDKMQGHTIAIYTATGAGASYSYCPPSNAVYSGSDPILGYLVGDGTNGTPRQGGTTEPQNLSLNFIIKL